MSESPIDTSVQEEVVEQSQDVSIESPEQQEPQITQELIDQATKSKDLAKMKELGSKLFNAPKDAPESSSGVEQVEQPVSQQQKAVEPAKKVFKTKYAGREIEYDDPNGLLGYKSTGDLKKAKIHAEMRMKDLEEDLNKTRRATGEFSTKTQALERERDALLAEVKAAREALSKNTISQQTVQLQQGTVQKPVRPKYPDDLPVDSIDWTEDHWKKVHKYNIDLGEYQDKLDQYYEYRVSSVPAKQQNFDLPPEVKEKFSKIDAYEAKLRAREEELQRAQQEQEYWSNISNFQDQHKSFKTNIPIHKLHTEVDKWMDQVARANGVVKPVVEAGPEWASYMESKAILTGKYLRGDPAVVSASEGIEPPQDYKVYFDLADLQAKKTEYVNKGILGPSADLHRVYTILVDETGEIDNQLNRIRVDERMAGANAITGAMEKANQYASAIPPDAATGNVIGEGLSNDDIEWFQNVGPGEIKRLAPDDRKRYNAIAKALNFI